MIADALAAVVAALEGEGLRAAVRSGDLTPPCAYVQIGTANDAAVLAGGVTTVFWVFWVPVRGVENLTADAENLDSLFAALSPVTAAALTVTKTSLTVSNDTWPCYRADVSVLAVPTATLEAA